MLEVKELQYFVVCADLSSFSRASEVLYTTQPNVSKVIRSLEERSLALKYLKGITGALNLQGVADRRMNMLERY